MWCECVDSWKLVAYYRHDLSVELAPTCMNVLSLYVCFGVIVYSNVCTFILDDLVFECLRNRRDTAIRNYWPTFR